MGASYKLRSEQVDAMLDLYKGKIKLEVIASLFGITPATILYHAKRKGVRRRSRLTPTFCHDIVVRVRFAKRISRDKAVVRVMRMLTQDDTKVTRVGRTETPSWSIKRSEAA